MSNHLNLQSAVIESEEKLNKRNIINQALIDILIIKKIISEEELVNHIGKITQEEEISFDDTSPTV